MMDRVSRTSKEMEVAKEGALLWLVDTQAFPKGSAPSPDGEIFELRHHETQVRDYYSFNCSVTLRTLNSQERLSGHSLHSESSLILPYDSLLLNKSSTSKGCLRRLPTRLLWRLAHLFLRSDRTAVMNSSEFACLTRSLGCIAFCTCSAPLTSDSTFLCKRLILNLSD